MNGAVLMPNLAGAADAELEHWVRWRRPVVCRWSRMAGGCDIPETLRKVYSIV